MNRLILYTYEDEPTYTIYVWRWTDLYNIRMKSG